MGKIPAKRGREAVWGRLSGSVGRVFLDEGEKRRIFSL